MKEKTHEEWKGETNHEDHQVDCTKKSTKVGLTELTNIDHHGAFCGSNEETVEKSAQAQKVNTLFSKAD